MKKSTNFSYCCVQTFYKTLLSLLSPPSRVSATDYFFNGLWSVYGAPFVPKMKKCPHEDISSFLVQTAPHKCRDAGNFILASYCPGLVVTHRMQYISVRVHFAPGKISITLELLGQFPRFLDQNNHHSLGVLLIYLS